ncbi:MAG: succinylglutamate desuccinylase/aspartoacylase family protein [Candidatus Nanohaloarchaea archaeon]
MKVEIAGEGEPDHAVVACLHGNELCGKHAVEEVMENEEFLGPVKFIIANEEALEKGERFVDEDLNRAFPGTDESVFHEQELAARMMDEIEGMKVLDLHSTLSHPEPFAIVTRYDDSTIPLVEATGVEKVVDMSYESGGMIDHVQGISVECGLKGSEDAKENAVEILRRFLAAEDLIEGDVEESGHDLFVVYDEVEGEGYEFVAENFAEVAEGEVFARKDGEELRAPESFYPVLMSTEEYEERMGYMSKKKKHS